MSIYWRCILRNDNTGYVSKDILILSGAKSTPKSVKNHLEKYDWQDMKGSECNCDWHIEKASQEYIEENDDLGGQ